ARAAARPPPSAARGPAVATVARRRPASGRRRSPSAARGRRPAPPPAPPRSSCPRPQPGLDLRLQLPASPGADEGRPGAVAGQGRDLVDAETERGGELAVDVVGVAAEVGRVVAV